MAKRVFTGQDGTLEFTQNSAVVKVISYAVTANLETLETTSLGDDHRKYAAGVLSYNGNLSIMYASDDTGSNVGTQLKRVFRTSAADQSTQLVRLKLGTNKVLAFNAYITSANIAAITGEVVRADLTFQSNGAPSAVTNI